MMLTLRDISSIEHIDKSGGGGRRERERKKRNMISLHFVLSICSSVHLLLRIYASKQSNE